MMQIRLSKGAIEKHRQSVNALRDTVVPQLFIKFGKRYVGYFHCRVNIDGNTSSVSIGCYPNLSVDQARELSRSVLDLQIKKRYRNHKTFTFETIEGVIKWYEESSGKYKLKKRKTVLNVQHRIHKVILPFINNVKLDDVTPDLLHVKWILPALDLYSASTLKGAFQTLKAAINHANNLGYINQSLLQNITFSQLMPLSIPSAKFVLQGKPITYIISKISVLPPWLMMMTILSLCCLTRSTETCLSRWSHFDFKNGIWLIPAENTKTNASISLPLSPQLISLLKNYKRAQTKKLRSVFLFPKKTGGQPVSAVYVAQHLSILTNRKLKMHDLRKYGATALLDRGEDYYLVERILNHRKTILDETYIYSSMRSPMRRSLNEWQEVIVSALPLIN